MSLTPTNEVISVKVNKNVKPPEGKKITSGREKRRFTMMKHKCCYGERGYVYTLLYFIQNNVCYSPNI
jgi:hypothetical protein